MATSATPSDAVAMPIGTMAMSRREQQVLDLFRGAFARNDIGLDDDFFELGGDSLLASRVLVRLYDATRVDLPPDLLFRFPTSRALAQAVDDETGEPSATGSHSFVPLNRGRQGLPFYLLHGVSGQPWVFQSLVRRAAFNRPVLAARAPDLDWTRDVLTIPEMVQHYTAAIRGVQRRGPYSLAGYSWGGALAFDIAMRLMADGQEVRHLVLFDTAAPAPWWRRVLSRGGLARSIRRRLSRLSVGPRLLAAMGYDSRLLRASACFGPGPLTTDELWAILRMAFPDQAKSYTPREPIFDDLCRTIVAQFKRTLADQYVAMMARLAPTDDPVASIKAHKVDAKNYWLARWHAPSGVFPGTLTIYASAGNAKVLRWQRFSSRPLDIRRVRAGADLTRAHQAFMEPPIVDQFARDVQELVER
jgi:thioesterase domain-containing protein